MKEIMIDNVKYVPVISGERGPLVLVRCTGAGVHIGELGERLPHEVTLYNARRLYYWEGANTLSEVSQNGIAEKARLAEPVPEILLTQYHEIIKVSAKAVDSLTRSRWFK